MDLKIADENTVRWLYQQLLEWWNERDAAMMVALCTPNATLIGFDGTQMDGRADMHAQLSKIFADHQTATYVWKIKEVRLLSPDVAILSAAAGMVPPGKSDINPEVNAIQVLTAVKQHGGWHIALFQNTPAAFHGRPEQNRKLTEDLREVLTDKKKVLNDA